MQSPPWMWPGKNPGNISNTKLRNSSKYTFLLSQKLNTTIEHWMSDRHQYFKFKQTANTTKKLAIRFLTSLLFFQKNIDSVRRTESYRAFLDADEGNCRLLLDIVTQTLKRPTSVCSNPGSPSPPPYDPSAPASRFSLSDNAECFIPI